MVESEGSTDARLRAELASFGGLWPGGFFVGDPLDPMFSPYTVFGYIGLYHAIYLACIKPYLGPASTVLELGPGRGAWTRTLLPAREIWCLDALAAEHNGFWEYVGPAPHVNYVQVADFSCAMLPDGKFDYLFSYDTLCHVSFDGIEAYVRNLRPKLKEGAHCFLMVADFDKYRAFVEEHEARSVYSAFISYFENPILRRLLGRNAKKLNTNLVAKHAEFLRAPEANGWFHAGAGETCDLVERYGYRVVDRDIGVDPRNPIVHFVR
jgi:Methyltransferase domain